MEIRILDITYDMFMLLRINISNGLLNCCIFFHLIFLVRFPAMNYATYKEVDSRQKQKIIKVPGMGMTHDCGLDIKNSLIRSYKMNTYTTIHIVQGCF